MKFVIKVYTGNLMLGEVYAKTISEAKMKSSKMCNNYFSPVDRFVICGEKFDGVTFYRNNKLFPNNLIIRGKWK